MAMPEWGYSYNALYVPLTSDWQCSLVPARDVQDVDRGRRLSYEERQRAREEREEQIARDRRDFDRLFRVGTSRRAARGCDDFRAYVAFISDHLRMAGLPAPLDGKSVTRILRDAVRGGWLIPAIDRAWRGSRRVTRSYAPQGWQTTAGGSGGAVVTRGKTFHRSVMESMDLDAERATAYIEKYNAMVERIAVIQAASAAKRASTRISNDLLDAMGAAAGAVLGSSGDDSDDSDDAGKSGDNLFADSTRDAMKPLGDAQTFEYTPYAVSDESFDVAGLPDMTGDPDSWIESGPGIKKQWRMFGPDGSAAVDIDFDSHHGQPNPHAHNWDGNSRDQGWPVSILPW